MSIHSRIRLLATALCLSTATLSAAHADPVRLRGMVANFSGSTLTVDTREGQTETVTLSKDWAVSGVAKASIDEIKAGDFVGIASVPNADGSNGALEVVIFPAAMKGTGEGSYAWDLQPDSTMTNATVANAVTQVDGRSVTLTYDGGQTKTIDIPAETPIVTFAKATPADLVPGATVFVPAEKAADGSYSSSRVVVGTNGVVPPM